MKLTRLTQDDPIGTITLDNSKQRNALSHTLLVDVIDTFTQTLASTLAANAPLRISVGQEPLQCPIHPFIHSQRKSP